MRIERFAPQTVCGEVVSSCVRLAIPTLTSVPKTSGDDVICFFDLMPPRFHKTGDRN